LLASALIVIGASTGGLSPLRQIVAGLSPDMPAAICVVQHIGAHESHLPNLLDRADPLAAVAAEDGSPIEAGRIYIAPSDQHLIVGGGTLHLTRGPRENYARPAIDPLFRSAAESFGRNAIGVILTGKLNDGTAGLYEIKRRGGIAVAQDPDEAESPDMPASALNHVMVDYILSASAMPQLFNRLASRLAETGLPHPRASKDENMESGFPGQRPVTLTCPECGGSMRRTEFGTLVKFDCHIGHSLTAESVAAGQFSELDRGFEAAFRRMNERRELCRMMIERAVTDGQQRYAEEWKAALRQTEQRSETVRALLADAWIQPEMGQPRRP
jgi:two-component system chemotaxis response regulator CheB